MLNLALIRVTGADDRQFDRLRAVFMHHHPSLEACTKHGASRLSDLERRSRIASEDQLLDGHLMRPMFGDQGGDLIEDQTEPLRPGMLPDPHAAARDAATALAVGIDHAVTGVSRAGIDPEDTMPKRRI